MAKRPAKSFKRVGGKLHPQPRVLVLCEDTKSSKIYLQDAAIYFRSHALVKVAHSGRTDPLGIVQAAIDVQGDFDCVYVVVDRDTHHGFDEAVQLANAHEKIVFSPSFPCFEFWLLLHFAYTRAEFVAAGNLSAAGKVIQELRSHPGMANYAKGDDGLFNALLDRLETAIQRARQCLADVAVVGNPNPSTHLHSLLEKFKDLGHVKEVTHVN